MRNWKIFGLAGLLLLTAQVQAVNDLTDFFERPVSCPLRFSKLSGLRDQVQMLVTSLGPDCAKNTQQSLNSLTSNVSNLEGITNSFSNYGKEGGASEAQYAKNVNQILGSLNVITSNTSCFYDIRQRGLLPVVSDVVMSISQFGLLVPSGTGMLVAAGGYIAGSGLKIVNELVKKKFNFNRPDDRRAFIQLNCAFFDNRRTMEESGIFDLSTDTYREEFAANLRRERAELIKERSQRERVVGNMEEAIFTAIEDLPEVKRRNLSPRLLKKLEMLSSVLASRPADYASKLRQVSILAREAAIVSQALNELRLHSERQALHLLRTTFDQILPELELEQKAWTNSIDEWEKSFRGPLMAFMTPVTSSLRQEIISLEGELALSDPDSAKSISRRRTQAKELSSSLWIVNQRILSLESKISKLESSQLSLFSEGDEGTSNEVEILSYYRKLQNSILGKEGKGYLRHALKSSYQMQDALQNQLKLFNAAKPGKEQCAAAEKLRFAWTQYRFKVQEAHDFVATNLDLYRSSFRVGKERMKRPMIYVLRQIESVESQQAGEDPGRKSVGELMNNVQERLQEVESKLHASGCF